MAGDKESTTRRSNHSGPGDDPSAEEGVAQSLTGSTANLPMPRFVEQTTLELPRGGGTTTPAAATRRVTLTGEQLLVMTATTGGRNRDDEDNDDGAGTSTSACMVEDERLKVSAAATIRSVKDSRTTDVQLAEEEVATQTDSKGYILTRTTELLSPESLQGTELSTHGAHHVTNDDAEDLKHQSSPTPHHLEGGEQPLTAMVVTHEELEARIRQQVLSEAVVAHVVRVVDDDDDNNANNTSISPQSTQMTLDKEEQVASMARKPSRNLKRILVCLTVGLTCIGIAITLGVILSRDGDDDVLKLQAGSVSLEQRAPDWWIEVSPLITVAGSPQHRAYEWMVRNDKVDEESRFRNPAFSHTFALATFYYATGGTNWKRSDNWMDPEFPICRWYPGDMCRSNTTAPKDPPQTSPDINDNIRKRRIDAGDSGSGGGGASKPKFSRLALPNNGLVGELPDETSLLAGIEVMDLSDNELTGPLRGVGSLFRNGLQNVRLEGNPLTGRIPSKVCKPFTDIALPSGGEFAMDCLDPEIECPCCTICCLGGSSCETTGFTGV